MLNIHTLARMLTIEQAAEILERAEASERAQGESLMPLQLVEAARLISEREQRRIRAEMADLDPDVRDMLRQLTAAGYRH